MIITATPSQLSGIQATLPQPSIVYWAGTTAAITDAALTLGDFNALQFRFAAGTQPTLAQLQSAFGAPTAFYQVQSIT